MDLVQVKSDRAPVMAVMAFMVPALAIVTAGTSAPAAGISNTPGSTFQDCETCPQLVVVPPGYFEMGFDGGEEGRYEGPVRKVTIDYAFALGRTEVTQAQYRQFVEATGHQTTTGCAFWDGKKWDHAPETDWRNPGYGRPPADNEPVACVTWIDAAAYVNWLAKKTGQPYRLPSEAEWEFAVRAGTTGEYTWGNVAEDGCRVANIYDRSATEKRPYEPVACADGFQGVSPVASFAPNPFGLYDMTGNVWEWVQDCYMMPIPPQPIDGRPLEVAGPCDRRVVKGGGWSSSLFWQRPTFRGRDPEGRISSIFGLRVARDLVADK